MKAINDKMTILVDVSNPIWYLEISESWILYFNSLNAFMHSSSLPIGEKKLIAIVVWVISLSIFNLSKDHLW